MLATADRIELSLAAIERSKDHFQRTVVAIQRSHRRIRRINGASEAAPGQDLSEFIIVIVEDDDDNRDVLVTFLRQCGARVAGTPNRDGALAYLRAGAADVVITDASVTEAGTVAFVDALREMPHHKTTPVIAVTGWSRDRVGDCRFAAFLQKPVDLDVLTATIRDVVRARAA